MKYNFEFIGCNTPLTIYSTGKVRFSKEAVDEFGLENCCIRWGIDRAQNILAFRKESSGRKVHGGTQIFSSCPISMARLFVGKHRIERCGDEFVLRKIGEING